MNSRVLLVLAIFSASHVVAETDCEAVVAATLEEMRLGAGEEWSGVEEAAARAAAGSACLKASSGRYGDTLVVESLGVAAAEEGTAASTSAKDPVAEEAGGIRINPMSGAPGQKPYERSR